MTCSQWVKILATLFDFIEHLQEVSTAIGHLRLKRMLGLVATKWTLVAELLELSMLSCCRAHTRGSVCEDNWTGVSIA
jgi:hypothetical protein